MNKFNDVKYRKLSNDEITNSITLPSDDEDIPHHRILYLSCLCRNSKRRSCLLRLKSNIKKHKTVLWVLLVIAVVAAIFAGVYVAKKFRAKKCNYIFDMMPISISPLKVYEHAAIVNGAAECTDIGRSILEDKFGSAVDAAIAVGLCQAVVLPESMGLGGGHFAVIYDRKRGVVETADAKETAPLGATEDMYHTRPFDSKYSGLSTGVPGELRGYWEMHQKYGKLSWRELFEGAIDKARNGFHVHKHFIYSMNAVMPLLEEHQNLTIRDFLKNIETGRWLEMGQVLKQPKLAQTLEKLSYHGVDEFYGGITGKNFVEDVRNQGGILTLDDLKNYKVRWRKPINVSLSGGLNYYSMPPPSSGALVAYILNIMDGYDKDEMSKTNSDPDYFARTEHRIVEAEKFAFAKRSLLGDEDYINVSKIVSKLVSKNFARKIRRKISDSMTHESSFYGAKYLFAEDHGTAHISVVDQYGNAVALTSSVNLLFGSLLRSLSTGIIIGNSMDDFSSANMVNFFRLQPSEVNFILPGKRPMSSMSPSIFVDKFGDVRLVIGAAGGTLITTSVALVAMRHLWMKQDVKQAIDFLRLHHQLHPEHINYEEGYPKKILQKLKLLNHRFELILGRTSIVQAISRDDNGVLFANSDHRKGGSAGGF